MKPSDDPLVTLVEIAFKNQDELNLKLDPAWATKGWPYYRAIWTEASEAIGHLNWYWWKAGQYGQTPTQQQLTELHIELCDILHFGLSLDIVRSRSGGCGVSELAVAYCHAFQDAKTATGTAEEYLEGLVVDAILMHHFNVKKFASACKAAGLSLTGLLTFYYAKTTLNEFRWANGYSLPKDDPGVYKKMWRLPDEDRVIEDNTFLAAQVTQFLGANNEADVAEGLQSGAVQHGLYTRLEDMYARIVR